MKTALVIGALVALAWNQRQLWEEHRRRARRYPARAPEPVTLTSGPLNLTGFWDEMDDQAATDFLKRVRQRL